MIDGVEVTVCVRVAIGSGSNRILSSSSKERRFAKVRDNCTLPSLEITSSNLWAVASVRTKKGFSMETLGIRLTGGHVPQREAH